ncbi:hypothetical protein BDV10DRAFT_164639 [Aspergillus recurvatus]
MALTRDISFTRLINKMSSKLANATPPVGSLRFQEPQSLNTTWVGSPPAIEYSGVSTQYAVSPSSVAGC